MGCCSSAVPVAASESHLPESGPEVAFMAIVLQESIEARKEARAKHEEAMMAVSTRRSRTPSSPQRCLDSVARTPVSRTLTLPSAMTRSNPLLDASDAILGTSFLQCCSSFGPTGTAGSTVSGPTADAMEDRGGDLQFPTSAEAATVLAVAPAADVLAFNAEQCALSTSSSH